MWILHSCQQLKHKYDLYENIGEAIYFKIKPKNNLEIEKIKFSFIICIEHDGASKKTRYFLGLLKTVFLVQLS